MDLFCLTYSGTGVKERLVLQDNSRLFSKHSYQFTLLPAMCKGCCVPIFSGTWHYHTVLHDRLLYETHSLWFPLVVVWRL